MMTGFVSGCFLLLFLLSSTVSGSVLWRYFLYSEQKYTWQEAQSHCRRYYNDLATIYSQSDKDRMDIKSYDAFIGLYKTNGSIWRDNWDWSDYNTYYYYYRPWVDYEPSSSDGCAVVKHSDKRFYGTSCEEVNFFICHERKNGGNLKYTFIPESKTWSKAQLYCRTKYDDLATTKDNSDVDEAAAARDFPVWIGLHRDGGALKWSSGVSEYQDWASSEPGSNGDCVSIMSLNKKMATQDCSARFPFVCENDNLVLVKENKTWEEALEHCRGLNAYVTYDLVSVEPGDHEYIINRIVEASTEKVWTGLRFLAGRWLWVNGAQVLYTDLPPCPIGEQRCGVFSPNGTGVIETADCLERRNFLCYRG